jgi:hypothetical protein
MGGGEGRGKTAGASVDAAASEHDGWQHRHEAGEPSSAGEGEGRTGDGDEAEGGEEMRRGGEEARRRGAEGKRLRCSDGQLCDRGGRTGGGGREDGCAGDTTRRPRTSQHARSRDHFPDAAAPSALPQGSRGRCRPADWPSASASGRVT